MSKKNEFDVVAALGVTAEICGTQLSEGAALMMSQDLNQYPVDVVLHALERCRRELTGRLSLAAILERIETGHPGTEEAWAMFPKSEAESAVVTDQMLEAARVAMPLYIEGDHVGARMAWKETYPRLVSEADGPPHWNPSLGWDQFQRVACLTEAAKRGQLSAGRAISMLGGSEIPEELVALAQAEPSELELERQARIESLRNVSFAEQPKELEA